MIAPTTTADDLTNNGNCTLREAVQAANTDKAVDACPAGSGADVIQLASGSPYVLSLAGSGEDANATGDLDVTAPVTIQGPTGGATIDAGSIDRVIDVHAGAPTTLVRLTLTNGRAPDGGPVVLAGQSGGGVSAVSALTLTNVSITNSSAGNGRQGLTSSHTGANGGDGGDGGRGGAVSATAGLTINGGSFTADHAGNGVAGADGIHGQSSATAGQPGQNGGAGGDGGRGGSGGAVAAGGQVAINDATFSNDDAGNGANGGSGGYGGDGPGGSNGQGGTGGDGGPGGAGGSGGAIFTTGPTSVSGGSIASTSAGDGAVSGAPGAGGASPVNQTLVFAPDGHTAPSGDGGDGGGISAGPGTLNVGGTSISGGLAGAGGDAVLVEGQAGGTAGRGGSGGAIAGTGTLTVDRAQISLSQAGAGGASGATGGFFLEMPIPGAAGGDGGGVDGPAVTITNTSILDSTAGTGGASGAASQAGPAGTGGGGGGVHAHGTLTLSGSTLDNDSGGTGGAGAASSSPSVTGSSGGAGGSGGGVLADANGAVTNVTFQGDHGGAGGAGGAGGGTGGGGGNAGGVRAGGAGLTLVHLTAAGGAPGAGGAAGPADANHSAGTAGTAGTTGGIAGAVPLDASVVANNAGGGCAGTTNGPANFSFPDPSCGGLNMDPKLGPLASNGGPTLTRLPAPGSPVIDLIAAGAIGCQGASTDQRGVPRPQGSSCDSGAVETANPSLAADPADFGTVSVGQSATRSITVRATFDPLTPTASLAGPDAGAFALAQDGCSGRALAPAGTCTIAITFTAGGAPGSRSATLHLSHTAAGPPLDVALGATVVAQQSSGGNGNANSGGAPLAKVGRESIAPAAFPAAPSGPSTLAAKRHRVFGARVTFTLNEAARVRFTVLQPRPGRRGARGRCVAPTRRNRRARRCTRLVALRGSFTLGGHAGTNRFRFTGRVNGHALKPGSYRLVATPTAHGRAGRNASVAFRVIR